MVKTEKAKTVFIDFWLLQRNASILTRSKKGRQEQEQIPFLRR